MGKTKTGTKGQDDPPILVDRYSYESLRDAPVHLDSRGRISYGEYVIEDDRQRNFRRLYRFCLEYLTKKRLPPDISRFWKKDLIDVVDMMHFRGHESITRDELTEIVAGHNDVAEIRKVVMERASRLIHRRYWKTRQTQVETWT